MLLSTLQQLRSEDHEFAVKPSVGSFVERTGLGLYQLLSTERAFGFANAALDLIPSRIKNPIGLVTDKDIAAIVDISGFALGDSWGPDYPEAFAKRCINWKSQKKKIILLPQAFGPFSTDRIRKAMRLIVENVDLLFARDIDSYNYLIDVVPTSLVSRIRNCNDITIGYTIDSKNKHVPLGTAIVPNTRVYHGKDKAIESAYFTYLSQAIHWLIVNNFKVDILCHDRADLVLANRLAQATQHSTAIISEEDPVQLKLRISRYQFIIGSRYHSLVAALSQNVPCIAIGWSHKYNRLLEDYGLGQWVFSIEKGSQDIPSVNDTLSAWIEFIDNSNPSELLAYKNRSFKDNILKMWQDVRLTISNQSAGRRI